MIKYENNLYFYVYVVAAGARHTSYNKALMLRQVGTGQEAGVPWVAKDMQCYSLN